MSQIERKWIEDNAIDASKVDPTDNYAMHSLTLGPAGFLTIQNDAANTVFQVDQTGSALIGGDILAVGDHVTIANTFNVNGVSNLSDIQVTGSAHFDNQVVVSFSDDFATALLVENTGGGQGFSVTGNSLIQGKVNIDPNDSSVGLNINGATTGSMLDVTSVDRITATFSGSRGADAVDIFYDAEDLNPGYFGNALFIDQTGAHTEDHSYDTGYAIKVTSNSPGTGDISIGGTSYLSDVTVGTQSAYSNLAVNGKVNINQALSYSAPILDVTSTDTVTAVLSSTGSNDVLDIYYDSGTLPPGYFGNAVFIDQTGLNQDHSYGTGYAIKIAPDRGNGNGDIFIGGTSFLRDVTIGVNEGGYFDTANLAVNGSAYIYDTMNVGNSYASVNSGYNVVGKYVSTVEMSAPDASGVIPSLDFAVMDTVPPNYVFPIQHSNIIPRNEPGTPLIISLKTAGHWDRVHFIEANIVDWPIGSDLTANVTGDWGAGVITDGTWGVWLTGNLDSVITGNVYSKDSIYTGGDLTSSNIITGSIDCINIGATGDISTQGDISGNNLYATGNFTCDSTIYCASLNTSSGNVVPNYLKVKSFKKYTGIHFGEQIDQLYGLVTIDCSGTQSCSLLLPAITSSDIGSMMTVMNLSSTVNTVFIAAKNPAILYWDNQIFQDTGSYVILAKYTSATFMVVATSPDRWTVMGFTGNTQNIGTGAIT